jgi:ParB-like chromosome segregation protein Spo0J
VIGWDDVVLDRLTLAFRHDAESGEGTRTSREPDRLRPYPGNARSHSRKQLKLTADSIKRFGFTNPILVTNDFEVVAGHGRLQAAKSLGMQLVPIVALSSQFAV